MNAELTYFLRQLINGLSIGSMYAIVAVGYSMVYSILYLINFAHGDLYIFGTFIAMSLINMGFPLIGGIFLACIMGAIIAMSIERTVYRPIREANRIVPMISALGAALVLRTVAQLIWGPEMLTFPPLIKASNIQIGELYISKQSLVSLIVAGICVLSFTLLLKFTKIGKATQCVIQDLTISRLMGIPINIIVPAVYALGGFFGVIGGVMMSSYYNVISIEMGLWGTMKAWAASQLGGVGSFYGAFLGGILLGLAETFAGAYIHTGYKDAVGYVLIVIILLFKPVGLFGKKKTVKV